MDIQDNISQKVNQRGVFSIDLVSYLKGIAIIFIVICHFVQIFNLSDNLFLVTQFLQCGCQIFFLLSSFTLCLSYSRNTPKYFPYLKRRISKIVGGYWLVLAIYCLIGFVSIKFFNVNILGSNLEIKNILINIFLLNGLTMGPANNNVIFGGWFVGTIVILYVLFPALFKLYNLNNEKWKKVRMLVFPVAITIVCTILIKVGSIIYPAYFSNYFCFLNQLPCFSLGFVLFDLHQNNKYSNVKFSFILSAMFIFISFICFVYFKRIILMPTFAGIGFLFLYIFLHKTDIFNSNNRFMNFTKKVLSYFGTQNYEIYLTHSFVVYAINRQLYNLLNDFISQMWLKMLILLPITIILVISVAKLFSIILNSLKSLLAYFQKKFKVQKIVEG